MDAIFKALNDPNRRLLLDRLREKDGQSLQELEESLEMTRFGVMKHLKLLEDAGLIVTRKSGRFKYHYLNALPLQEVIDRWIEPLLQKPLARAVLDLKAKLEGPEMLETVPKPDFVMSTFIRTTHDRLWEALVDPDEVMHYHFMATAAKGRMDQVGDSMAFMGTDGEKFLVMHVNEIAPKTRIDMTFEHLWEGSGMPKSRCVYRIEPLTGACRLTIEHYDVPAGQEGIADGWERMVSGLKSWLETGKATHFGFEGAAE